MTYTDPKDFKRARELAIEAQRQLESAPAEWSEAAITRQVAYAALLTACGVQDDEFVAVADKLADRKQAVDPRVMTRQVREALAEVRQETGRRSEWQEKWEAMLAELRRRRSDWPEIAAALRRGVPVPNEGDQAPGEYVRNYAVHRLADVLERR